MVRRADLDRFRVLQHARIAVRRPAPARVQIPPARCLRDRFSFLRHKYQRVAFPRSLDAQVEITASKGLGNRFNLWRQQERGITTGIPLQTTDRKSVVYGK